jgi:hypothetical protein
MGVVSRGAPTQRPRPAGPPAAGAFVYSPVTPAASLAFPSRSVVPGASSHAHPEVAHRPRRTGWTARARPGPGYDPGGIPAPGS